MTTTKDTRRRGASGGVRLFLSGMPHLRRCAIPMLLMASASLSGCAHWMRENANINGAQQLSVNDAATRRVDLPRLIRLSSPNATQEKATTFEKACGLTSGYEYAQGEKSASLDGKGEPEPGRGRMCLELATQAFHSDAVDQARRRNEIQARLMAASDAECAQFVQHLNSLQGYGNLTTGSLTTIFSGAGAIVTGVNAARALAGLGAITSGLRAEFNSDLFLQQAAPTVGKAIAQQRETMTATIAALRAQDIRAYPLWSAIGDAFKYNDQCSLVKGLGAMDRALDIAANPGLDSMEDYWLRFNRIRVLSQNPQITSRSSLDAMSPSGGGAGGTSLAPATGPQALAVVYQGAVDAAYTGEQQLLSLLGADKAVPDLANKATCASGDVTVKDDTGHWADCLRRAALAKLQACVGEALPSQFAELTTREALVRSISTSATPAGGLANASFERDKLLLAAKAQADWIGILQGYTTGTFASAQQLVRQAVVAKGEGKKDDPSEALARDALKNGVEAVNATRCLNSP